MLNTDSQVKIRPPRLIPSLMEGFNIVASQIYLILFPVVFDLVLWFGPLVRVKNLLTPIMIRAAEISGAAYGEQEKEIIKNSNALWSTLLEGFNLLFGIRTYPIGIPSLLISQGAQRNPLGALRIIEIGSIDSAILLILGLSIGGVILGSLYFALVAHAASKESGSLTITSFFQFTQQSMVLSILLVVALIVLGLPAVCLMSSIVLLLPALGSIPFMVLGLVLVWVLLPLAFSPHGIFMGGMKATRAIVTSFKLVRSIMSGAGMFFIIVIILGYGMDALWSTPSVDNWMLLVGIFGHGFISSGLLASTFVFYRDGVKWLNEILRDKQAAPQKAEFKEII
jgi:hypothetical protein